LAIENGKADRFEHLLNVLDDVRIPEAYDCDAATSQPSIAVTIAYRLCLTGVLATV
jgi:hypothetical protein